MKTYNLVIYHCLTCGSVAHCEPDHDAPECCGHSMTKAAARTVHVDEVVPATKSGSSPPVPHSYANCGFLKPR
jgi:hypothetical protein